MAGQNAVSLSQDLSHLPTIYADGVGNLARGPGVVKFYLVRFDPNLAGNSGNLQTVAGQVVMSQPGFVATALFFQKQLTEMVDRGEIDRGLFAELTKVVEQS